MPRIRSPIHPMTLLLRAYGLNGESLGAVLNCTPPTARKKIREPGRLTINDLETIHKKVGIPINDIREAIV